jgi:hypothetical protein
VGLKASSDWACDPMQKCEHCQVTPTLQLVSTMTHLQSCLCVVHEWQPSAFGD